MDLIRRLLSRRAHGAPPPIRPDRTICVVGDIHGCDALLGRLLALLAKEVPDDTPLVCVGDYIDRGPDSAAVLARLQRLTADPRRTVICLMGNHEDMMLSFLDDPVRAGPAWCRNGGFETLDSFGIARPPQRAGPDDWRRTSDALRGALGPATGAWLRDRPLWWQSGNVLVTHAGADPDRAPGDQDRTALIWGHPHSGRRPRADGLWVAQGHRIVPAPDASAGRIRVDTGAFATGRLTAAIIAPDSLRFLST